MPILLAFMASLAALFGGWLALASKSRIGLLMAGVAGAILGLVAFDILPEIFELSANGAVDAIWPMMAMVTGFLLFHTIERLILVHHSHEDDYIIHRHPYVGVASSIALIGHSLLDGISIGLAFQIDSSVGLAVSIAVVGHRFADGFSNVSLMLRHGNKQSTTIKLLVAVIIAPVVGTLSTLLFSLPTGALAIYLGFFAGFMLYISAGEILPQAHSKSAGYKTIGLTVAGVIFMLGVSLLAG